MEKRTTRTVGGRLCQLRRPIAMVCVPWFHGRRRSDRVESRVPLVADTTTPAVWQRRSVPIPVPASAPSLAKSGIRHRLRCIAAAHVVAICLAVRLAVRLAVYLAVRCVLAVSTRDVRCGRVGTTVDRPTTRVPPPAPQANPSPSTIITGHQSPRTRSAAHAVRILVLLCPVWTEQTCTAVSRTYHPV